MVDRLLLDGLLKSFRVVGCGIGLAKADIRVGLGIFAIVSDGRFNLLRGKNYVFEAITNDGTIMPIRSGLAQIITLLFEAHLVQIDWIIQFQVDGNDVGIRSIFGVIVGECLVGGKEKFPGVFFSTIIFTIIERLILDRITRIKRSNI